MHRILCLSLLSLCGLAAAQSMRPGLWETSFTMKSQSGQMEQQMARAQQEMANLPPEQRKMIEQMMAQKGLAMGGRGALGSSIRVCVSKEQAERLDMPQREGHCTQEIVQRSASTIKVKFSCAGNPPSSGEGEINFLSPTAYNGRMTVHTQIEGQPERMNMSQTGTWLSDDCGTLKPVKR